MWPRHLHRPLASVGFWSCLVTLLLNPWTVAQAAEPLETETANTLKAGLLQLEAIAEYQTSADGKEFASPIAIEYGIVDDLELLLEPVFFTAISPTGAPTEKGLGDLEVTSIFRFLHEGRVLPNVAVGLEVKVPTARNHLIGTGQTDYAGYLIASKHIGRLDLHGNVGYAILGQPAGIHLNNIWNFAAAAVVHLGDRFDVLSEFLASTSPVPDGGSTEGSANPEIAGAEMTGMLGMRYYLRPGLAWLSAAATYDNNSAVLFRTALSWRIPTR